jgi:hypothetical protein
MPACYGSTGREVTLNRRDRLEDDRDQITRSGDVTNLARGQRAKSHSGSIMGQVTNTRYRVIATSLLSTDIDEADRVADALRGEGWPHANRSLVIREALARLSEDLHGKTTEEIFRYFIDRRGRRIAHVSKSSSSA